MKASTVIEPGATPNTVDITVSVEDTNPLRFGIDFNNYGSQQNGYNRPGASVRWGNLTGVGDELDLHGFTTLSPQGTTIGTFNYLLPVDSDGTKVSMYYSNAAFGVGAQLEPLDIRGSASVYGAQVLHPFVRSTTQNIDFQGGFLIQNIHNEVEGTENSRDFLREIVVGFTGDFLDPNGRWYTGAHLTQDMGTLLGGMASNDPLSSRMAGGGFDKWVLDAARIQRLNHDTYLIIRGSQQYVFQPMPVAEQFALGGVDTVRGYHQASYLGDGGYDTSVEFRWSVLARSPDALQLVCFFDHGGAYVLRPQAGEASSVDANGAGFGFRLHPNANMTLNFDLATPVGSNYLTRTQGRFIVPYIFFSNDF